MYLFAKHVSHLCICPTQGLRGKTVLKVKCFKEASLISSSGIFVSWCNTRERFQEGIPLHPLGLSPWKVSRRRVRFSSLLTLKGEFPSLSTMADLYPSLVPGCNFLSWNRYIRKSTTDFIGGCLEVHLIIEASLE